MKAPTQLTILADGVEALRYLRREGKYANAPFPHLVFLDWSGGGREVLSAIKNNEALKAIPVIVMTAGRSADDVVDAYEEQANCCVAKPAERGQFLDLLSMLLRFWIGTAHLPSHFGPPRLTDLLPPTGATD